MPEGRRRDFEAVAPQAFREGFDPLAREVRRSALRAEVGERVQHDALQVHRCVAYLPGDVRLFRRLKPIPFLRLFAALRADPSAATRGIETAERLQLDLGRRIALMSTGMRQKLALAATFATRADVLSVCW